MSNLPYSSAQDSYITYGSPETCGERLLWGETFFRLNGVQTALESVLFLVVPDHQRRNLVWGFALGAPETEFRVAESGLFVSPTPHFTHT